MKFADVFMMKIAKHFQNNKSVLGHLNYGFWKDDKSQEGREISIVFSRVNHFTSDVTQTALICIKIKIYSFLLIVF